MITTTRTGLAAALGPSWPRWWPRSGLCRATAAGNRGRTCIGCWFNHEGEKNMRIVIDVPDDRINYRSRAARCLRHVAEFFDTRPADTESSGVLPLGPGPGVISWSIEGVQQ